MRYSLMFYIASFAVAFATLVLDGGGMRTIAIIAAGGLSYALFSLAEQVGQFEDNG